MHAVLPAVDDSAGMLTAVALRTVSVDFLVIAPTPKSLHFSEIMLRNCFSKNHINADMLYLSPELYLLYTRPCHKLDAKEKKNCVEPT